MKNIALLSSVPLESDILRKRMKRVRTDRVAGRTLYRGRLASYDCILFNTGIGKVNAAHGATVIIERFSPDSIINFGVGGAYRSSGLKVGDIAAATEEILGDEGVSAGRGTEDLRAIGIPLVKRGRKKYFNEFKLDSDLLKKVSVSGSSNLATGRFVTVSAVTGTARIARSMGDRFGAVCENMEGAAIAQVCALYNIPMFEIRGISNIAGVRDKSKWDLKTASRNCQEALIGILEKM